MMAFLLAVCLLAACLPLSAGAAQTDLSAAECMEIAKAYWNRLSGEGIAGGNSITFQGKKYYNYVLRWWVDDHWSAIDYLFVETATGNCYYGLEKPEYQIFKNYEEVLRQLIEKESELYALDGEGVFFDLNGDGVEELLTIHWEGDEKLASIFEADKNGKVHEVLKKSFYHDVGGPHGFLGVIEQEGKQYLYLLSENGETSPDGRSRGGWIELYQMDFSGEIHLCNSAKYHFFEKYDSIDYSQSSAEIDGKSCSFKEFENWKQSFTEIVMMGTTDNNDGYTFEELLEQCGSQDTPPDPDDSSSSFSDVFSDDYYKEAVEWAVELGITNGTGNGKFSPNAACTRAQIVTFLWRAAGSPEPTSGLSMFSDVEENEYYGEAVRWAIEQGITNGTGNGKFSPEAACTRGQAVTFLWRAAGEPSAGTAGFSDVYTSDYYAPAVNWAVQNDVTAGTGNNRFSPNWKCTRAQIVTFLYRYAN